MVFISAKPIISEEFYISDHCFVMCNIAAPKRQVIRRREPVRSLKNIDTNKLKEGLDSINKLGLALTSLNECVSWYGSALSDLLDNLAPITYKYAACRTKYPWFSDHLQELKKRRRKAEINWRKSNSTTDSLLSLSYVTITQRS